MKNLSLYLTAVLLVLGVSVFAQKQGNIWYFGDHAGLDFNYDPVQVLSNGQLVTQEGVATISSGSGQLLFYTDGVTVYNANHQVMLNGNGLNGHYSATQSGVIVPNPADTNIYYVFTVDELADPNGLCYSEVNMTLDGGLGAITTNKNIQLLTPVCEKITAVLHDNYTNIWVLTHEWNSNSFYAYLVDGTGVNTTAVISNVGGIHSNGTGNINAVGYMKVSPAGEKLAVVNRANSSIDLFDFNRVTGQVQPNPVEIGLSGVPIYGVEFSPNGQFLYVGKSTTVAKYSLTVPVSQIASTGTDLINSVWVSSSYGVRALQVAPDGDIYVSLRDYGYISRIENPNSGADTLVVQAVDLGSGSCNFGLPTFIQSYFGDARIAGNGRCQNSDVQFEIYNGDGIVSVEWEFDDPGSGANNTSSLFEPSHVYTQPGNYNVSAIISYFGGTDTLYLEVDIFPAPIVDLGNDTCIAPGDSMQLYTGPQTGSINWNTGETTEYIWAMAGTYSVTVVNEYECEVVDEIHICPLNIEEKMSPLLYIYPNPVDDFLVFSEVVNGFKVFDLNGKLILESKNDTGIRKVNIEALPNGVYFVKVENNYKQIVLKLVKE